MWSCTTVGVYDCKRKNFFLVKRERELNCLVSSVRQGKKVGKINIYCTYTNFRKGREPALSMLYSFKIIIIITLTVDT